MSDKESQFTFHKNQMKKIDEYNIIKFDNSNNQSWIRKKWLESFETIDENTRLAQGRTLAKKGQVANVKFSPGLIEAKVHDNKVKPYSVKIELNTFNVASWITILKDISNDTSLMLKMISKEMQMEFEFIANKYSFTFFPQIKDDLKAVCSCPDWVNPCKHTAAVYYIVSQIIEKEPFILFLLRGLQEEELMNIFLEMRRLKHILLDLCTNVPNSNMFENKTNLHYTLERFWALNQEENDLILNKNLNENKKIDFNQIPFYFSDLKLNLLLNDFYEKISKISKEQLIVI